MPSEIKKIISPDNYVLASAAVPEGYITGGALQQQRQHERVPFTMSVHVLNTEKQIFLFALSDEMFTTYRNELIKQGLRQVPNVIWSSIRDFIEPEQYLQQFSEAMTQMRLTMTAQGELPSVFNANLRQKLADFRAEYDVYFQYETQAGAPTYPQNLCFRSYLRRFTGVKDNQPYVVLSGMDYKGIEYYTTLPMPGMGMFGMLGGGSRQRQSGPGSLKFGYGNPCDAIEWGAENRFIVSAPQQYEAEATQVFADFVSTYQMSQGLRSQFIELRASRAAMMFQQSLQYQQMAQQARMNLQYQQQKLTRMLQENSAAMSAGIMDSWDKKMASDSRISANYSEAIRGVNTYQTTSGRPVEVSVTADHVYENRYGDVYGVSGTAPDQETLNRLNWTELGQ